MSKYNYHLCTSCNQDMRARYHKSLNGATCSWCGQGIGWRKRQKLDRTRKFKKVTENKFLPNYSAPDQELRIGKLAKEIIQRALLDLRDVGYRQDALEWFNKRDTHTFGYGWCLEQSRYNHNTIRRGINKVLGMGHG